METIITLVLIGILAVLAGLSVVYKLTTISGAIAGFLTGLILLLALDWAGLVLLFTYFPVITGTVSVLGKKYKQVRNYRVESKGRNWWQALANTGAATLVALVLLVEPQSAQSPLILAIVTGFAASLADTVAGELGILSRTAPVSIISFKPVKAGTNGGVSLLGTVSSALAVICFLVVVYWLFKFTLTQLLIVGIVAMSSSVLDSVLGATIEDKFIEWWGEAGANNAVNAISTTAAVIAALVIF